MSLQWPIMRNMLTVTSGFIYFGFYTHLASTYLPRLPNWGKCTGEEFAAYAGMVFISSYLVLFILFYLSTYKKIDQVPNAHMAVRSISEAPALEPHAVVYVMANGHEKTTGVNIKNGTIRSRKA